MKHLIKRMDSSFQKFINKPSNDFNSFKTRHIITCLNFFESLLINEKHARMTAAKRYPNQYFPT